MKKFEIYVHIPFCRQKCQYCDFLSFAGSQEVQKKYMEALLQEIRYSPARADQEVSSVFFGGGTPSIVWEEYLVEILDTLKDRYVFAEDTEISLEANPGTVDEEKLGIYRTAGFNRISFGCQSTFDEELKNLGRIHTYQQFLEEYEAARRAGFTNINVDLMSGLPGQTYAMWETSLRRIAALGAEHISAYSLILEEGTPFFAKRDTLQLPDEDTERKMYEETAGILAKYGYEQYEISNYAKPGYRCRHNIGYWIREDYLGFGLGAASLMDGCRFTNPTEMEQYLSAIQDYVKTQEHTKAAGIHSRAGTAAKAQMEINDRAGAGSRSGIGAVLHENVCRLDTSDCMEEYMILGLRMTEGVSRQRFYQQFGQTMETVYGPVIRKYKDMNLLKEQGDLVSFTKPGISVSNVILADFLQD